MHGEIIAVHTGCPGSAADFTAFKRIRHYQDPSTYFPPGEFLLADSAYEVSRHCVPPFKSPAAKHPDNAAFNYYLAHSRVRSEHCIGVLKRRWESLKELRNRLQNDEGMERICHWVVACCVLHNIMSYIDDRWMEEPEERITVGESNVNDQDVDLGYAAGTTFRENLKKTTLEANRARGGRYCLASICF